ncbi:alpha/beta hydrolase [Nocardioides panacisoli]|uniref:alpha/beta fold hydrolase n=1 Tax=Nocardioides panacisoli TaxID=627624 RepID=UPI001C630EF8|nr:alpha/beta fold hydrolase [Nocardioides panacisoli]QYJ02696.1 alpha/beta hydrolase [Nocardioides panacisoli]
MTTHRLRTADDLELHVSVHGPADAPLTVLLAHCWTADEDDWHYQTRAVLSRYGHGIRLLTWDHRGHGRSEAAPEAACTIAHLTRDLGAVVDAFAPTGPLLVAGHSIGGMVMTAIPEERPDLVPRIRGLLFVSTSAGELDGVTLGFPEATAPLVRAQLPRMLATRARILSRSKRLSQPVTERRVVRHFLFGRPRRLRDTGLVVDQLINCPPATMSGFVHDFMTHERAAGLAAYAGIPATVLVGTRDLLTPPPHARRLARHLPGARLLVAPEAGHMLPLERDELVSTELCRLIDSALATRGARVSAAPARADQDRAPRDLHPVDRDGDVRVVQAPAGP